MGKKPFWILGDCHYWSKCDDCGCDISPTKHSGMQLAFNPNKRAVKKRICIRCYDSRIEKAMKHREGCVPVVFEDDGSA